jgi:hypothetical protein
MEADCTELGARIGAVDRRCNDGAGAAQGPARIEGNVATHISDDSALRERLRGRVA